MFQRCRKRSMLFFIVLVLVFLLSGCAKRSEIKPVASAIPTSQPMAPAIIYMPSCSYKHSNVISDILSSEDDAASMSVCNGMRSQASESFGNGDDNFIVVDEIFNDPKDNDLDDIRIDRAAEKNIGARYRVVVGKPMTYRKHVDRNGAVFESLVTSVNVLFVEATTGRELGAHTFSPDEISFESGEKIIKMLARGLRGPRCNAYDLTVWNPFKVIDYSFTKRPIPKCHSFSLPADDADDID